MLTKTQIQVASSVLRILEQEGATFAPTCTPSRGYTAAQASHALVEADAELDSVVIEFREEAVCFSVEIEFVDLAQNPAECIERAMLVRRALVNMPSN